MRATHRAAAALSVLACVFAGCTPQQDSSKVTSAEPGSTGSTTSEPTASETPVDPSTPLGWGPTVGELEQAQEIVAAMSSEQLAGQVIVGRYLGSDPAEVAAMLRKHHLAGISITNGNVVDEAQVRAMTAALTQASLDDGRDFPPVLGVDQEGGYVSHLRGIATEFPAFDAAGAAIESQGAEGRKVVSQASYATGLELRDLGFTWVFAPVADVTIGAADPTIGTRSASEDPAIAAEATAAAVRGFDAAGVVSTVKHFPGHGGATSDSHDTLPRLDSPLAQLQEQDLPPFEAAIATHAPAVMLAHLDLTAIAPGVPSSLAPEVYELLREDLGFEGVAITDSLGMGAVASSFKPAVTALNAGADLLLMPVDTVETHRVVTKAIDEGEVSRERAEEAAARVVAVQLWQQRAAAATPIPPDVTSLAQDAAAALTAAAY
ncbi:glycoside hydrolase family 3 N-terminal domain-containing protein [Nocardioides sp.]|uniref:glycoside hydrolase family 3 N-terminal domain-containing protein n=1 Tax=Nocardioides sp. TaxID=35761 RepID=UPI002CA30991|nr:glycoside hydrolase family 3 N-terminal domain-containing protein [Nocardioides sp.]HXH79132.1 glycoside hydrolase family 3 N-terminal domain-containing protein [Nocardioides sp.]